jgi:hypothetical protein
MAQGLLDGVLGGEEEKIDPTEGGTEPMVAAVAANLASQNPEVAAETVAMFRKQTLPPAIGLSPLVMTLLARHS